MEEKIELYLNDTYRALDNKIEHLKKWRINNSHCNQEETYQVILKLEEAKMWSLKMVKRDDVN